jgi:hypothetical protein
VEEQSYNRDEYDERSRREKVHARKDDYRSDYSREKKKEEDRRYRYDEDKHKDDSKRSYPSDRDYERKRDEK